MNWDQVVGQWTQIKGQFRERWGKLTDDDLDVINGRSEQFIGALQKRYGIAKEAAEEELAGFLKTLQEPEALRPPRIDKTRHIGRA